VSDDRLPRRRLLWALAAGAAGALAGCPAGGSPGGPDSPDEPTSDDPATGAQPSGTAFPPATDDSPPATTEPAGDTPTPAGDLPDAESLGGAFGAALAISDGSALVGDAGADAAFAFDRREGAWAGRGMLPRPDQSAGSFGASVTLGAAGDHALLGDPNGTGQSAFVSARGDAAWSDPAPLNDQFFSAIDADGFGAAIAANGDVALVGSPGGEGFPGGQYPSSAYVYERATGRTWLPEAKLVPGPSGAGTFAESVAMAGTTALVGDPRFVHPDDGLALDGVMHAFGGAGDGAWYRDRDLAAVLEPAATVLPSDAGLGDGFGRSIAASGDRIVVGAPALADTAAPGTNGAAYAVERSDGAWRQTAVLLGDRGLSPVADSGVGDGFGFSVALSGSRALVSAPRDPAPAMDHRGAAYVFERADGTWTEAGRLLAGAGERIARFESGEESAEPRVRPPEAAPLAWFGGAVALADGTALVQAGVADSDGGTVPAVEVFAV
jgi:hypothetical protein